MRAMNKFQYDLVKFFLTEIKIDPRQLVRKWNAYWLKTGSKMRIESHEVYRVVLTVNYDVYKKDLTPAEDVVLAMEGLK